MNTMRYPVLALTALTALGACGGSGTPTTTPPPTTRSADAQTVNIAGGGLNDTLTVQYAPATDTLTFASANRGALNLAADTNYDLGEIAGYRSGNERWGYAIRTDSSQAAVVATNGDTPTDGIGALQVTRIGTATAPLSGASTYNGDYAGFIRSDSNTNNIAYHVDGDVTLTVDFADNTVEGEITDRDFWNFGDQSGTTPDGSLGDLTLNATTLDDELAFDGNTSGGALNLGGASVQPGQYSGLVTGGSAEEAVGGVGVSHSRDFGPITLEYNEIGIFKVDD